MALVRFLGRRRFNWIDAATMSVTGALASNGHVLWALFAAGVGMIMSASCEVAANDRPIHRRRRA